MKRIVIFVIVILFTILIAMFSSCNNKGSEGLEYHLMDDGTYAVSCGSATQLSNIIIPKSHNGKKVTTVINSGFENCKNLKSITISNGIKTIENYAFSGCTALTTIEIPSSVTNAYEDVFRDCQIKKATFPANMIFSIPKENLETVIINGGTSIESQAFKNCTFLTSVTINDSILSISDYAFSYCSSLKDIKLSKNITEIGVCAFECCFSLDKIVIPNSTTHIGGTAFVGCYSLKIFCEAQSKPNGWHENWSGGTSVEWGYVP